MSEVEAVIAEMRRMVEGTASGMVNRTVVARWADRLSVSCEGTVEAAVAAVLAVNAVDGKALTHAMARRRAVAALESVSCGGTPPRSQRQGSVTDQMGDLMKMAVERGMYDAHDWLRANFGGGTPPEPSKEAIEAAVDALVHTALVSPTSRGNLKALGSHILRAAYKTDFGGGLDNQERGDT